MARASVQAGQSAGGSSNWTDGGTYLKPVTDGDSIRFYDAGGTKYGDFSHNGSDILVGHDGVGTDFLPASDNAMTWGTADNRWSSGYLTGNFQVSSIGDKTKYVNLSHSGTNGSVTNNTGELIFNIPLTVTIGTGGAGTDYQLKFDGQSSDGIITFDEGVSHSTSQTGWFNFDKTINSAIASGSAPAMIIGTDTGITGAGITVNDRLGVLYHTKTGIPDALTGSIFTTVSTTGTGSGTGRFIYGLNATLTADTNNNGFADVGAFILNGTVTMSGDANQPSGYNYGGGGQVTVEVSGDGAEGYGFNAFVYGNDNTVAKELCGFTAGLTPDNAGDFACGTYVYDDSSTLNNPSELQVGHYIAWDNSGTDSSNNRWAFYNDSSNTTAGKIFLGKDNVKTYGGTGFDYSFTYDGTDLVINPQEVGTGALKIIDGDTYWTGDGSGVPYGSCWGNEIGWSQASASQNTWYNISDTDLSDGQLNLVAHDGSGKLTVTKAGRYVVSYSATISCSIANDMVATGIEINSSGSAENDGQNHVKFVNASSDVEMSGQAILDLAASSTIEVCIRTTDSNTPNLSVDHLNIVVQMVGGT